MRSISNFDDSGNIILRNRQLNFNNLVAVVTDSRVQEDTLILVYYSEATQPVAQAANINVQTNTGNITFTAANQPTGTIVCDIVLLSANIVNQVANASDIDYSNASSGLTATDVQGAVDEVADVVTSVEDKLSDYIKIQNVAPPTALTWTHGDFIYFNDYKPSDTNYTWYLLNVMPSVASIIICGIQSTAGRALVYLPAGGSVQAGCNITWIGVKN